MSQQALVDTKIQIAQCNRCQAWIFLAQSGGLRAAADPAPATRDAYIQALTEGRRTFRLATQAGRPHKLLTRRLKDRAPDFAPEGVQRAVDGFAVLVEHGCGSNARNAVVFTPMEEPKPVSVCETWKAQGWEPPKGKCKREGNPMLSSCVTCEKPPFSQRLACDGCKKLITPGEEYWGFQHGDEWMYASHVVCDGSGDPGAHPRAARPSDPSP